MLLPIGAGLEDQSVKKIWEEGDSRPAGARQDLVAAATGTRKVVNPLPLEHSPVTGLPETQVGQAVAPVPEQQKQAGCASGRTAMDEHGSVQTHSLYGDGSWDAPGMPASVQVTSVRKVVPGDVATPAGNVPAATQRRRPAGKTRAGETTPPEYTPKSQGARPFRHQQSRVPGAYAQSADRNNRPLDTAPLVAKADSTSDQPAGLAVAADGMSEKNTPDYGSQPKKMRQPANWPADPGVISAYPWSVEHQAGRTAPRHHDRGKTADTRESSATAPRVQIGTIEVVVLMPVPQSPEATGGARNSPDLSSRHYLRNC